MRRHPLSCAIGHVLHRAYVYVIFFLISCYNVCQLSCHFIYFNSYKIISLFFPVNKEKILAKRKSLTRRILYIFHSNIRAGLVGTYDPSREYKMKMQAQLVFNEIKIKQIENIFQYLKKIKNANCKWVVIKIVTNDPNSWLYNVFNSIKYCRRMWRSDSSALLLMTLKMQCQCDGANAYFISFQIEYGISLELRNRFYCIAVDHFTIGAGAGAYTFFINTNLNISLYNNNL